MGFLKVEEFCVTSTVGEIYGTLPAVPNDYGLRLAAWREALGPFGGPLEGAAILEAHLHESTFRPLKPEPTARQTPVEISVSACSVAAEHFGTATASA